MSPKVEFVCEVCHKRFSMYPSDYECRYKRYGKEPRFCSFKCRKIAWAQNKSEPKPRKSKFEPSEGRTEYTCKTCGRKFYLAPCDMRDYTGDFCSQDCKMLWKIQHKGEL